MHHAEEKKGAPVPINARAEKGADSAYFRSAFSKRRVIIPADGWYEFLGGIRAGWRAGFCPGSTPLYPALFFESSTSNGIAHICLLPV
ncbi:SOS response-associated peptidase family protein [Nitrococcus mobilis]|uniref:Uncharacterized protein n=1 Tax=Nitrococcus mobilis Nb-231 TaxID=314278 RepID=A4BSR3_9GAMM|nr:hypothetical protein NB231_00510 [Nitrococcus mobilis Nb-231]